MGSIRNVLYGYSIEKGVIVLMDADLNFSEFDDVTIRRIVECIQVNTDKHILVTLKGGLQGEELI